MARLIIGAAVAAVLVFFWGFLAWAGLHLYKDWAFRGLSNESVFVSAMETGDHQSGAYFVPWVEHADTMTEAESKAAMETWVAKHKSGPLALVIYNAQGADPESPVMLARGFAITFFAALLLGVVVRHAGCKSYVGRVLVAVTAVLFAITITHGIMWNYFHLPLNYTQAMMIDGTVGWAIGSLVLAAFIKPAHTA